MRSIDARRRNFIGTAARPSYQRTGFLRACDSYAGSMPSRLRTPRIPTSLGSLIRAGENPCSTSPCSSDLRSCACTSLTSASAIAGKAARAAAAGRRVTPMPFLCPACASAVDFLCASGPLSSCHEIANSYPVAPGRYRPSGAFRRRRLSDARRSADRDRPAARDSPRGGARRHRGLAIARDRLGDPASPLPERKQPCSMSF
jgi:hypothetical protein